MPIYTCNPSGDIVLINSEQGPDPWTIVFPDPTTARHNYRVWIANTTDILPSTPVTFDFNGAVYLHPKLSPTSGTSIDVVMPGLTWEWVYRDPATTGGSGDPFWFPLNDVDQARVEELIVTLQVAGYGSQALSVGQIGPDLGLGWVPLPIDSIEVPGKGVTLSSNGEFQFTARGVWQLAISLNISHNNSNQGRTSNVRLYEVTGGIAGITVPFGIARNVEDTHVTLIAMFTINEADLGDTWRVEVGGGDTVSAVNWNSTGQDFTYQDTIGSLV